MLILHRYPAKSCRRGRKDGKAERRGQDEKRHLPPAYGNENELSEYAVPV